jgi:hypothetical protein
MGQKLPPDQLELYQRIDEILGKDWDPIGVSEIDGWPHDEYRMYLPQVFQLALKSASAATIADYLNEVTTKRMGLHTPMDHHLKVAEMIHKLKPSP